jgi:hypothetical protein
VLQLAVVTSEMGGRGASGHGDADGPPLWRTFIAFELAPISAVLTADHVARRIAAERAPVDERGAVHSL